MALVSAVSSEEECTPHDHEVMGFNPAVCFPTSISQLCALQGFELTFPLVAFMC